MLRVKARFGARIINDGRFFENNRHNVNRLPHYRRLQLAVLVPHTI
ncbi:MAG TPA: hypothetical protein VF074_05070 [Pyrinomonadaceae bacterium]